MMGVYLRRMLDRRSICTACRLHSSSATETEGAVRENDRTGGMERAERTAYGYGDGGDFLADVRHMGRVPRHHWEKEENRRSFLLHVGRLCGVEKTEDWRKVKRKDVVDAGGSGLFSVFASLSLALRETFPEIAEEHSFGGGLGMKEKGFWSSRVKRKEFLTRAGEEMGVREPELWLGVTRTQVMEQGGRGLFQHFSNVLEAVIDAFPEYEEKLRGGEAKRRSWREAETRRRFLCDVAAKKELELPRDWQSLKAEDIRQAGGGGLLLRYGNHLFRLFASCFSESELEKGKGRKIAPFRGFWEDPASRRQFLDSVASSCQVTDASGWAKVSSETVQEMGGAGLLAKYNGSLWKALQDVYPEQGPWDLLSCRPSVPQGHWETEENVRAFMDQAGEHFGVQEPQDWYRVSLEQMRALPRGGSLMQRYRLVDALRVAYPKVTWQGSEATKLTKKAAQRNMTVKIKGLLM